MLRTYCLACKKHIDNLGSKNVLMTNKSRFMKQNHNKKR